MNWDEVVQWYLMASIGGIITGIMYGLLCVYLRPVDRHDIDL